MTTGRITEGVWVSQGGSDTHPLHSHEDGTVRFWDASGVALRPLYKLSTAGLFQTDCEHADSLAQAVEDDWPPFRKVPLPSSPGLAFEPDLVLPSIIIPSCPLRWAALTPTVMIPG